MEYQETMYTAGDGRQPIWLRVATDLARVEGVLAVWRARLGRGLDAIVIDHCVGGSHWAAWVVYRHGAAIVAEGIADTADAAKACAEAAARP